MSQHGSGYGGYGGPPGGGSPPGGGGPGYPPGGGGPGYPPGGGGPGYPPGGGGPGYPPGGGGYPPGGGGPGYPPGGGGPGYPPGGGGGYPPGYGAPQGPPGYGPPGGGGYPPGGGMPGAPAPAKKSNALMWVGLGCGGLFLLSAIGGGIAVYMAKRATDNAIAAASSALAAPLTPPVAGGDPATPAAGATGTCAKAVECCIKIIQKTNPGAQNEAACAGLKQLPEANCALPLTTYQKSAQLLGVKCD